MAPVEPRLQEERLSPFVRVTLRIWVKTAQSVLAIIWPFFDVIMRIELAQTMVRTGVSMMLSPSVPHMAIATIALVAPILLIAGFGTSLSALALIGLILAGWRGPLLDDTNLILLALLCRYVVAGAGAISIDRLISQGLGDSALPFAAPVIRARAWLKEHAVPLWLLASRLWIAATLLATVGISDPGAVRFLPIDLFELAFPWAAVPLAVSLAIGFGMPLVALITFLCLGTAMVMSGHVGLLLVPTLVLGVLGLRGAGALSVDRLIKGWLERNVLFDRRFEDVPSHWPHVVVVGGGFGGLAAVTRLKALPVRVTLIDRNNYHLFQPLLYQIATAALSPADVATPIRSLFRGDGNVQVLLGTVDAVDTQAQRVHFGPRSVNYDYLLIATGATHSYFGRDEWGAFAPGLKTIEDGVAVRARVLRGFERAEACIDQSEAARNLTFVIVGAGPTGVELAGAIAELAHQGLKQEYRNIDPASARILLVQSGARILPSFPPELSHRAHRALTDLGVEILLESRVTKITANDVALANGTSIATETVLWAAGVVASPAALWLDCPKDKAGRIEVDAQLRVAGSNQVFAIGDTAASHAWGGKPVPGLAPAAKQAGLYFARYVEKALLGRAEIEPFEYRHQGSLATIGRKSAVADFGRVRLHGAIAWWLWGAVHIGFLAGMRNRVAVLVNWVWSYFTMRPGIRLITDRSPDPAPLPSRICPIARPPIDG